MFRHVFLSLALTAVVVSASMAQAPNPVVVFETSMGNITVELAPDKAPKTVANFLMYVKEGFYSGTTFHRVIPGFMIQGGGFTPDGQQKKTKAAIVNEASNGLKNVRGAISMARTDDPNSATSQFFIVVADSAFLDYGSVAKPGYAVFGKVLAGMDVADKIVAAPRGAGDKPNSPIMIKAVTVKGGK